MIPNQPAATLDLDAKLKMDLLYKLSKKISSTQDSSALLEQIIRMTQKTLGASAASILLFKDNEQELYFEAASGPAEKSLKSVIIDTQYSIAGHVARTGKPLIVNNVTRNPNFHAGIDKLTGFVTNSLICAPLMVQQKIIGVLEVLNKLDGSDFTDSDLEALVAVGVTSAMAIENDRLRQSVLSNYKNTLITLIELIDAKDPYTKGHSQRVKELTLLACSSLSFSPSELDIIEYASLLHDIGKISIDSQILNKPGELTTLEWSIVKKHPSIGANLLKKIPLLEKAGDAVLYHHEKYDGSGYPHGLKGDAIPLAARIISVADAFDTMTTSRSYRQALSLEDSVQEIKKKTGTHFCPVAVQAFISGLKRQAPGVTANQSRVQN